MHINKIIAGLLCTSVLSWSSVSQATIVEIDTSLGKIQVNLYDDKTPATVTNFLSYVSGGSYTNSIFHRSVPGFVVQGGGFIYDFTPTLGQLNTTAPVINEPVYSNVRGTIAMAKQDGLPNSATSQFFFNLDNNSANLDNQNSGFTVFGQVVNAEGLAVIDAIAALNRAADFGGLPLRNFPPADGTTGFVATEEHYVLINQVDIIDAATDTAINLTRPLTTHVETAPTGGGSTGGGGGGGNFGLASLLMLGLVSFRRRFGG